MNTKELASPKTEKSEKLVLTLHCKRKLNIQHCHMILLKKNKKKQTLNGTPGPPNHLVSLAAEVSNAWGLDVSVVPPRYGSRPELSGPQLPSRFLCLKSLFFKD